MTLIRLIYSYDESSINHLLRYKGKVYDDTPDTEQKIIEKPLLQYEFASKNMKDVKPSIYFEILRKNIITKLISLFIKEIRNFKNIKNLGKIFKYNKLEEYVQQWCWLQYNNKTCIDTVIPYVEDNNYNFNELIETFNYNFKINLTPDDSIIKKLKNKVSHFLKKEYNNFINEKEIVLTITKIRNEDEIILYTNFKDTKYSISINNNVYIRLLKKYLGEPENIDTHIFILIYRYSYIDAENQQLAIHKKIKEMFREYNVNFELYGSAINALSDNYCSLFYDIEKYFGSHGNFFDIDISAGIYWCNPPYVSNMMTNTAKKLIKIMNNHTNVAFIITIPIWDKITQDKKTVEILRNNNKNMYAEDFDDYPIYSLLKPFIKDELIIPKKKIPYFNYRHYKPINAVDTYMLIVYKDLLPIYHSFHEVFDKIIILDKSNYFELE